MNVFERRENWGPDEQVYRAQSLTVREYGVKRGFRLMAERFVSEQGEVYPSPLRWLWILLLALTSRFGWRVLPLTSVAALPLVSCWVFQSWLAGLLSLTSPLVLTLGRRALQDVTVGVAVLIALGFSLNGGEPLPLAVSVFALLALKEAAVLYLPALFAFALLNANSPLQVLSAFVGATVAWLGVTRLVVGPLTWTIFGSLFKGHNNPYARDYQSGGLHRLWVDMFTLSPMVIVVFLVNRENEGTHFFVFIVLAMMLHGITQINNIRTVLVVDLVLRGVAMVAAGQDRHWWFIVVACIATDLAIAYRIRRVYDPTTFVLGQALGFFKVAKS